MKPKLTITKLIEEAQYFCVSQSNFKHKEFLKLLMGKPLEQKFQKHLHDIYEVTIGSSASGVDLPSTDILTDIKVTSINFVKLSKKGNLTLIHFIIMKMA